MLLETLDIKENDILIYSQNLFDNSENFRIVFKDDVKKEHRKISVNEVYSYVNQFVPKNLIVYRILTNIKNFDIYPPRYGFFLSIHKINELIYFDPIYAIKEIEDYGMKSDTSDLRFRIQQVGLTTLNRTGKIANFAELYSIDMKAEEAKYQNDKIFADAILADVKQGKRIKPISASKPDTPHKKGMKKISHDVSEDKEFDKSKIRAVNYKGSAGVTNISGLQEESDENADRQESGKNKESDTDFSKFTQKDKQTNPDPQEVKHSPQEGNKKVFDIFKSPEALNKFVEERKQKSVILKLNKK